MPRACLYPTAASAEIRIQGKEEHLKSNQQEQRCDEGAVHEGRGAEYLSDICLTKPQIELGGASLAQASLDDDSVFRNHRCRDEPS